MKGVVVNSLGNAPSYQDFPDPVPNSDESLVEIVAAGLHPIVKAIAAGQHYSSKSVVPFVAGIDAVGRFEDGKIAYCLAARPPYGTMADRTVVIHEKSIPLPDGLDLLQAAAIANPGMSAWLSLKSRGGLTSGETVLINGATGVAGHLAVQTARYLGARKIIATGRNQAALNELGADVAISLAESDDAVAEAFLAAITDQGIDVVIDYLWGHPTELLLAALARGYKPEGSRRIRLVEVGESAGKTIALPGALLRSMDISLLGSGFGSVPINEVMGAIPRLFPLAAEGHLRANVESVPLAEVEAAWSRVEKGKRIVFAV
jgi:NADPH2:quinone reductase